MTFTFLEYMECKSCLTDKFSDSVGIRPCSSCDAGTYSGTPGVTSADTYKACEAEKASYAGANDCST